jgi:hypothetical protein
MCSQDDSKVLRLNFVQDIQDVWPTKAFAALGNASVGSSFDGLQS